MKNGEQNVDESSKNSRQQIAAGNLTFAQLFDFVTKKGD